MKTTIEETFGPAISCYSRAQAIEDGVLVDMSEAITPCPFKYPIAMTIAAYGATITAGGRWVNDAELPGDEGSSGATLELPGGQDVQGRAHDLFAMLIATMKNPRLHPLQRDNTDSGRIYFAVIVDAHGNGRKTKVELYAQCGPGDTAAPVITIMLQGED